MDSDINDANDLLDHVPVVNEGDVPWQEIADRVIRARKLLVELQEARDIANGQIEYLARYGLKVPVWDRTETRSVLRVGPWTAILDIEEDEEDECEVYSGKITGPLSDSFYSGLVSDQDCRGDAELYLLRGIVDLASMLEPLQRFLESK